MPTAEAGPLSAPFDEPLLRLAPVEPLPVAAGILAARDSIREALANLRRVRDEALERPWIWRDSELDVRYGFYRQYEALEDARARVRPLLASARASERPTRPLLGSASAARWELYGVLAGLSNQELDRDPGNGEWTVRQTVAHIVSGQRGYGLFTAWWLSRHDAPADDFPARPPDELDDQLPDEETEGLGSAVDIARRLDDTLDQSSGVFAPLGEQEMAARARWSGVLVDVGFRLGRWSSHVREHTIQVDKTLGYIGRPASEVERLVRLISGSYGHLEEEVYMWPADGSADAAVNLARSVAEELLADSVAIREAAAVN